MDTTVTTVTDRVQAGAALLDQAYVNRDVAWWDQVDLDRLDMASGALCVVAQTVGRSPDPDRACWCGEADCDRTRSIGSYAVGLDVLGIDQDNDLDAMDLGFTTGGMHGFRELEDTWRELILARRASAAASE